MYLNPRAFPPPSGNRGVQPQFQSAEGGSNEGQVHQGKEGKPFKTFDDQGRISGVQASEERQRQR